MVILPLSAVHVSPSRVIPLSPPFLSGHYPTSSVLRSDPTPGTPFGVLAFQGLFAILPLLVEEGTGPPGFPQNHCPACLALRPRGSPRGLAVTSRWDVAFRVYDPVGLPDCRISWLHHIQAYWLTVNTSYGGLLHRMHDSLLAAWLSLTRWEFHPLNPATLPGRFRKCENARMREKLLIRTFQLPHNPRLSHLPVSCDIVQDTYTAHAMYIFDAAT